MKQRKWGSRVLLRDRLATCSSLPGCRAWGVSIRSYNAWLGQSRRFVWLLKRCRSILAAGTTRKQAFLQLTKKGTDFTRHNSLSRKKAPFFFAFPQQDVKFPYIHTFHYCICYVFYVPYPQYSLLRAVCRFQIASRFLYC